MNKDVRNYVATCEACQKSISKMEKAFPELHPILVPTKGWHQVGVDLCNLPKIPGYVGICVVTDYFSKLVEAKSQINDQGREFCNKVSENLFNLIGTSQRITSAYHPQANGLVERAN